jgi:predicted small integral membrane protein/tetratricopeptide (TPR) repeat protein
MIMVHYRIQELSQWEYNLISSIKYYKNLNLIKMKYKIIKYLTCIFTLTIATTSCVNDEDLVQVDPNVKSFESTRGNDASATAMLNSAYVPLSWYGMYGRNTNLMLDGRGDDVRTPSRWDAIGKVGSFGVSPSEGDVLYWAFSDCYKGTAYANQVIASVPKMNFADASLKNRIIGQAYFLRGLYLFHSVNMFRNVPIPLDINPFQPQKSQAEGWAQVIADFKMATDLLPLNYNTTNILDNGQLGRATKGAALAYLGKAYLFTQDFANARDTFKKVIDSGVYSLMSNYADNFSIAGENNVESIFEVQFNVAAQFASNGARMTTGRAVTFGAPDFGWTDVQPTFSLLNEFKQEKTISNQDDPRLDATIIYNRPGMQLYGQDFATHYANTPNLNEIFCRKYENTDTKADEKDWLSEINERLMRYSDVLLMYAESLNETGDTPGAYTYIQMVRNRVNLPNLATVKPNMTQSQMRDQIGHERLLEFALEGHRFDDIRRWGWLENPTKLAWLKSRDAEFEGYASGREYFPIPQKEMETNKFPITQNPSY